jgi:hypothetical protein
VAKVSAGNPNPSLNDPDFFRVVTDNDSLPTTNPFYDTTANASDNTYGKGGTYGASLTAIHNARVYSWYKAAHPLINAIASDCLAYLRPGNQLAFNQVTDANGNSYYIPSTQLNTTNPSSPIGTTLFDTDGVTPIVPPTISITPGGALNEPAVAQQVSDLSQGVSAANYVPTVYKTSQGQISGYPTVGIAVGSAWYGTAQARTPVGTSTANDIGTALASGGKIAMTDLIEYSTTLSVYTSNWENSITAPVFDVTQGSPVAGASSYVAFAYDPTSGSVNFAVAATPPATSSASADPTNPQNSYWAAVPSLVNPASPVSMMTFSLASQTTFPGNPLGSALTPNAQIVENSDEVHGPDETPGAASTLPAPPTGTPPAQYNLVPYTRVTNASQVGPNQYYIDYPSGTMYFAPFPSAGDLTSSNPQKNTILVSYKYQNNMTGLSSPTPVPVTVSYSSSSLVTVSMGVRVYDTATKTAAFFEQTNVVPIGNGSR